MKAVIPVAGLGTRMLPATKAIPKEMLPIVDRPLIQYVVNEAISAGITEIVLVTHSSKNSIENHFDTSFELEATLERIKKDHSKVYLHTHPFVAAYLTKGFPSLRLKWYFKHKKWVKIIPRDAYTYLEYRFFNPKGKEIK